VLELHNGIKVRGEVISQTDESITIRVKFGSRSREKSWPISKIRAVTVDGQRRVLGEKPAEERPSSRRERTREERPPAERSAPIPRLEKGQTRTKAETEAIIDRAGRTPPDWWDSVQLNYPRTLQLSWPKPKKGEKWTPIKYPGQYVISVINPNPRKWKEGAKLMHHALSVNKNNRKALWNSMNQLGHIYGDLLGDYARAAFWLIQAARMGDFSAHQGIRLARAYWKLGCKSMAKTILGKVTRASSSAIQLWAEMGDLNKALSMARGASRGRNPAMIYLAAGNACRSHGRYDDAVGYYEKILDLRAQGRDQQWINQCKNRARAAIEAIKIFESLDLSRVPDGKYTGRALGFRGDVEVEVEVGEGKIGSVKITKHREDWFFTCFTDIPEQIIENQSLKGVDAVTGATMTSLAIINATGKALANAME